MSGGAAEMVQALQAWRRSVEVFHVGYGTSERCPFLRAAAGAQGGVLRSAFEPCASMLNDVDSWVDETRTQSISSTCQHELLAPFLSTTCQHLLQYDLFAPFLSMTR
eukprot:1157780-Pelagomonas_calceolata.AAC.9